MVGGFGPVRRQQPQPVTPGGPPPTGSGGGFGVVPPSPGGGGVAPSGGKAPGPPPTGPPGAGGVVSPGPGAGGPGGPPARFPGGPAIALPTFPPLPKLPTIQQLADGLRDRFQAMLGGLSNFPFAHSVRTHFGLSLFTTFQDGLTPFPDQSVYVQLTDLNLQYPDSVLFQGDITTDAKGIAAVDVKTTYQVNDSYELMLSGPDAMGFPTETLRYTGWTLSAGAVAVLRAAQKAGTNPILVSVRVTEGATADVSVYDTTSSVQLGDTQFTPTGEFLPVTIPSNVAVADTDAYKVTLTALIPGSRNHPPVHLTIKGSTDGATLKSVPRIDWDVRNGKLTITKGG